MTPYNKKNIAVSKSDSNPMSLFLLAESNTLSFGCGPPPINSDQWPLTCIIFLGSGIPIHLHVPRASWDRATPNGILTTIEKSEFVQKIEEFQSFGAKQFVLTTAGQCSYG